MGYCVSDGLHARNIGDDVERRKQCNPLNGDWVLARLSESESSSYNFLCLCRYPHLMTNVNGPQSSCSKPIGCEPYGRLNAASREGLADPFVSGRCECSLPYVTDRNARDGPFCRRGTVEELPGYYLNRPSTDYEPNEYISLNHDAVDSSLRDHLHRTRLHAVDRGGALENLWVRNPCYAREQSCELKRSQGGGVWYCADTVTFERNRGERSKMALVNVGLRVDRDILAGNGGTFPNRCVCLSVSVGGLDTDRVLLQYMSQSWNDGRDYTQEIGFLLRRDEIARSLNWHAPFEDADAQKFVSSLARGSDVERLEQYGVLWTYANQVTRETQRRMLASLGKRLLPNVAIIAAVSWKQAKCRSTVKTCSEIFISPRCCLAYITK